MAESQAQTADQALAKLGYKSELPRHLGMMSILGLSFAIMAVPFGLSTTLYITLTNGQSVTILYGWAFVSLISLCIAASLAEICAVFPTAGGVYYWSAMLSSPRWAAPVSFVDGWLGLIGNWTVTLSINFSGAQLILSAISVFNEDYVANQWQTVLCFWAVMLLHAAINAFGSRYLDFINKLCVYWTAASVVIIIVTLLVMCKDRRSGEFVFSHYDASGSGWPAGWSFFVGLLQGTALSSSTDHHLHITANIILIEAAYTLTGYGMVAAMAEEVQK
jgi:amino acid transporter